MPREEVDAHQKERLFGATVAALARRGNRASTEADLEATSASASRTSYDLYADKLSCFLEALQAILGMKVPRAGRRPGGFAETAAARPATAKPVLVEAYAAGPEVYGQLEGKQDATPAAVDGAAAQMVAAIRLALRQAEDRPNGVLAGLGGLLDLLAFGPAPSNPAMVELHGPGPEAIGRRNESPSHATHQGRWSGW